MRLKSLVARILIGVSALLIAGIHFFYSYKVGLYLYWLSGGINVPREGGWTHYGGATVAWTIPLQLPGSFLLSFGGLSPWEDGIAKGFVLAASIGVGYSIASLVAGFVSKKKLPRFYFDWRVLTIAFGMIWIPVPETWAFVYDFSVKY